MEPKSITGKSERTRINAGRRFLEDSLPPFLSRTCGLDLGHTHNTQTQQSTKRLKMAGHPVWTKNHHVCACGRTRCPKETERHLNPLGLPHPQDRRCALDDPQLAGVCPSFQHKKKKKKKKEWGCSGSETSKIETGKKDDGKPTSTEKQQEKKKDYELQSIHRRLALPDGFWGWYCVGYPIVLFLAPQQQ